MEQNGTGPTHWLLVIKPEQRELFELLQERLRGSGVEVLIDRRHRERRRGSLGPAMDRRSVERRRQRPLALLSVAAAPQEASGVAPAAERRRAPASPRQGGAVSQRCPTCAETFELEMPRFPHPPARVEMEVGHVTGNGRGDHHYVEIDAFTVSGRLILSQRVPARRPAS